MYLDSSVVLEKSIFWLLCGVFSKDLPVIWLLDRDWELPCGFWKVGLGFSGRAASAIQLLCRLFSTSTPLFGGLERKKILSPLTSVENQSQGLVLALATILLPS